MKVVINGRKIIVEPAHRLTVKQYFELYSKKQYTVLDYLSLFAQDAEYTDLINTPINNYAIELVQSFMNQLQPVEGFNVRPKYALFFRKKEFHPGDFNPTSLGVRLAVNQFATEKDRFMHEIALFILSCMLAKNYDYEESMRIYEELMNYRYIEVMPYAGFFLHRQMRGIPSVRNLWRNIINGR